MLDAIGLRKLWDLFCRLDNHHRGELNFHDLLRLLKETNYSIVAPYAEWLFDTIKKKEEDRVNFEEWVVGMAGYALLSREEVLQCK